MKDAKTLLAKVLSGVSDFYARAISRAVCPFTVGKKILFTG